MIKQEKEQRNSFKKEYKNGEKSREEFKMKNNKFLKNVKTFW